MTRKRYVVARYIISLIQIVVLFVGAVDVYFFFVAGYMVGTECEIAFDPPAGAPCDTRTYNIISAGILVSVSAFVGQLIVLSVSLFIWYRSRENQNT